MKKIMICGIVAALFICSAAIGRPKGQYKNLKVLPENISSKEMSRIMVDEFGDALGVSCTFCHAEEKGSHRVDYALDDKPEKEIARSMMRMTMKINKQFFKIRHPKLTDSVQVITCTTCHNGKPFPDGVGQ